MKAQELRIGNILLVSLKSGNGRKREAPIGVQDIVRIAENTGSFNYEYIPLTEEWLMKFGFQYFKENNSYQLDVNFGFSFWGRPKDGFNVYSGSDELGKNFEYVHQLQNLYFALTGTELTPRV